MVDSVATAFPAPLDVAAYERLIASGRFDDERVELLDGELVAMSPQGPPHVLATGRIAEALIRALDPRRELAVWSHSPFQASLRSMPEPDVVVVACPDWDGPRPTTARVVLRHSHVEVLTEPVDGVYPRRQVLVPGDTLRPVALRPVAIAVADVVPPRARPRR